MAHSKLISIGYRCYVNPEKIVALYIEHKETDKGTTDFRIVILLDNKSELTGGRTTNEAEALMNLERLVARLNRKD